MRILLGLLIAGIAFLAVGWLDTATLEGHFTDCPRAVARTADRCSDGEIQSGRRVPYHTKARWQQPLATAVFVLGLGGGLLLAATGIRQPTTNGALDEGPDEVELTPRL